jgi:hypothetical protein
MFHFVLALTFKLYTYNLDISKKIDKIVFLNTYNAKECNIILRIILHEKNCRKKVKTLFF